MTAEELAVFLRSVWGVDGTAELALGDTALPKSGPRWMAIVPKRLNACRRAVASFFSPRFADLLHAGDGLLASQLRHGCRRAPHPALDQIEARVAALEAAPLDVALRQYVGSLAGVADRRLDALLARLGLDGRPPRALVAAARAGGLSHERVRQLEQRARRRLPSHPVCLPALDRALDLVVHSLPADAAEMADALRRYGIATTRFDPASVIAAAPLCGRDAPFAVQRANGRACVVTPAVAAEGPLLLRLARRRVRSFGAASLADVLADATRQGVGSTERTLREALTAFTEAEGRRSKATTCGETLCRGSIRTPALRKQPIPRQRHDSGRRSIETSPTPPPGSRTQTASWSRSRPSASPTTSTTPSWARCSTSSG